MSLIRGHLSRDLKEVEELALGIFRRPGPAKSPEAGTDLVCLRNSRDGSFVEWREQVGNTAQDEARGNGSPAVQPSQIPLRSSACALSEVGAIAQYAQRSSCAEIRLQETGPEQERLEGGCSNPSKR